MFDKKWYELTEQEHALLRAYGLMREGAIAYDTTQTGKAFAWCAEVLKAAAELDWETLNIISFPLDT